MLASLITALFLFGLISTAHAVTLLYLLGGALIIVELSSLTTFGVMAFNGVLALLAGYMINTNTDILFGLQVGWPFLFSIACAEFLMLVGIVWLFLRQKNKPVTTGAEAMIGKTATIIEWKGKTGRVHIDGEEWRAKSEKGFKKDDEVTVKAIKNVTLIVES